MHVREFSFSATLGWDGCEGTKHHLSRSRQQKQQRASATETGTSKLLASQRANQPTCQLTRQLTSQARSGKVRLGQATNHAPSHHTPSQPASQPICQPANQLASQQTSQPANQLATSPICQPAKAGHTLSVKNMGNTFASHEERNRNIAVQNKGIDAHNRKHVWLEPTT